MSDFHGCSLFFNVDTTQQFAVGCIYLPNPTSLHRIAHQLLALLCALHLCGGKYALMQSLAWAGMAVNYSADSGIVDGLKKTFDGEHPCPLCQAIAKAKQQDADKQDKEPQAPAKDPKFGKEVFVVADFAVLSTPGRLLTEGKISMRPRGAGILPDGPSGPPPRA
jgi:hypothetical protein